MKKIIKLDFKKVSETIDSASYGQVELTNVENIEKIKKYILPIIAENEGWGTKEVTYEGFTNDPFQFQESIDASLFANVHIALDSDGNPAGLLEFLEETLENPVSKVRMNNLNELVNDKEKWAEMVEMKVIEENLLNKFFPVLKQYLGSKKIYSEIGVVVRPDLQGKKSGIAEDLYKILSDGILFGWTNNPVLIAQWRKNFGNVIYYPLLDEEFINIEYLTSLAILYADLLTYERESWNNLEFGTLTSPYFVSSRDEYYLELAKVLSERGKITELDEKRIAYCIGQEAVQGAIFAFC